jgi:hypothetical protein
MKRTLPLTAFKDTGKYYSEYPLEVEVGSGLSIDMYRIFDQVSIAMDDGRLPKNFIYYVNHELGWPGLVGLKGTTDEDVKNLVDALKGEQDVVTAEEVRMLIAWGRYHTMHKSEGEVELLKKLIRLDTRYLGKLKTTVVKEITPGATT